MANRPQLGGGPDDPVVASLPKVPHPYSSLAISPDRQHAVAATKNTLLVVRIHSSFGVRILKSLPVAQHFIDPTKSGSSSTSSTAPSSTSTHNSSDPSSLLVVLTTLAWSSTNPSFVAAAGSNGLVVVWRAIDLTCETSAPPALPQAVLSLHVRAVNRLAWHPKRTGWLLSASQDGKVHFWEQTDVHAPSQPTRFPKFWTSATPAPTQRRIWQCRTTFERKSEAVRDIQWSPFFEDVFAIVTSSGSLIVYHRSLPRRALFQVSAHSGDATTLDWHPTRRGYIATGGAGDRCVKVWSLEKKLVSIDDGPEMTNLVSNQGTLNSVNTDSSPDLDSSPGTSNHSSVRIPGRHKEPNTLLHVLTVSASVTRIRWRPVVHESMIAVATSPIKGASAGGGGMLGLWSWNRPYMALSIVTGHKEGAVTDFHWLDTPSSASPVAKSTKKSRGTQQAAAAFVNEANTNDPNASFNHENNMLDAWQHILSVGRDGRCLVQSLARGHRPLSQVSPSCFVIGNKPPYQNGHGSLQVASVFHDSATYTGSEFQRTGLRQDAQTAQAPGIFREDPVGSLGTNAHEIALPGTWNVPSLRFNIVDSCDQATFESEDKDLEIVASEVLHMSRFADRYETRLSHAYPTRVSLCLHNATVAADLKIEHLVEMWRMVAMVLENSGRDSLGELGSSAANAMQFVLMPTLKAILEERAEEGDLQTCVTLCEVLQVVSPDEIVRIDGLTVETIREWYLSYIGLLNGMCLFLQSAKLIRDCSDPFISALSTQSTSCGKELLSTTPESTARRQCKSCRRRVGFCFLCHEPVQGLFVWCPGCGHGGHLEHAFQWFGGSEGHERECPTGCGHRCNLSKQLTAFPRTESVDRDMFDVDLRQPVNDLES